MCFCNAIDELAYLITVLLYKKNSLIWNSVFSYFAQSYLNTKLVPTIWTKCNLQLPK